MSMIDHQNSSRIGVSPMVGNPWATVADGSRWSRILEDLRTGGKDPIFRRSMIYSLALHAFIIFGIPLIMWLMTPGIESYRLPKGSGVGDPAGMAPKVEEVKVQVRKQVKKPKKKFMVRTNSAISFYRPDIDDSKAFKEIEKATDLQYKSEGTSAQEMVRMAQGETSGGLVKGGTGKSRGRLGRGGGTQGGWPEGSENAVIRFIRLDHGGVKWDDNMNDKDRSDLNFLDSFAEYTGFKVSKKFEGYKMGLIDAMPKGEKPPFLYMTGEGAIPLNEKEKKQLRDYLLEGGLLFADCGSPQFDQNFRPFANSLMPGCSLVDISDDDPIFSEPFSFANGPPSLWHHGGDRCKGVKFKDRWVVFYFPGDLKDAFRTNHSGLSPDKVKSATELGINIINYSFNHYLDATKQYRK